jgi:hypothetical protein
MAINYNQAQYINSQNQLVLNKLLDNTGKINALEKTDDEFGQMVSYLSTQETQRHYKEYLDGIQMFLIEHDVMNLFKQTKFKLNHFKLTCAALATKLLKGKYQDIIEEKIKLKNEMMLFKTDNGSALIEPKKLYLGLNFDHMGDNMPETTQYDFLYWHELGHIVQYQGKDSDRKIHQANFHDKETLNMYEDKNTHTQHVLPLVNPLVNNDLRDNLFYDANASIIKNQMLNLFLDEIKDNIYRYSENNSMIEFDFVEKSLNSLPKEIYADTYSIIMLGIKNPASFDDYLKTLIDFRITNFANKEKYLYQDGIDESFDNLDLEKAKLINKASKNPKHNIVFTHNTTYGLLALKDVLKKYNLENTQDWSEKLDFPIIDLICKEVMTIGYARQLLLTIACNDSLKPILSDLVKNQENHLINIMKDNNFTDDIYDNNYWVKENNSYEDFMQYLQKIAKPEWVEETFKSLGKGHYYNLYSKEYLNINSEVKLTHYRKSEMLNGVYLLSDKRKLFNNEIKDKNKPDVQISFK